MKVVITGRMLKPRNQVTREFMAMGLIVVENVTPDVNYVVTGDILSSWAPKIQDAKKNGIETIPWYKFIRMLDEKFPEYVL